MASPASDNASPAEQKQRLGLGRRLIWLGTAISIILGSLLLFEPYPENRQAPPGEDMRSEPDLELSDAEITRFRDSGELKYLLRSPRIEHYEREAVQTYLTAPDLEMYDPQDPPWHMTAKRGTISNRQSATGSEEQVLLEDDVRMRQLFDDGRSFELRTPSITVFPDRQYAETSRDVIITTHAGRTKAVGLQGNLDQGLLQLYSNDEQRVHTILLPEQFK